MSTAARAGPVKARSRQLPRSSHTGARAIRAAGAAAGTDMAAGPRGPQDVCTGARSRHGRPEPTECLGSWRWSPRFHNAKQDQGLAGTADGFGAQGPCTRGGSRKSTHSFDLVSEEACGASVSDPRAGPLHPRGDPDGLRAPTPAWPSPGGCRHLGRAFSSSPLSLSHSGEGIRTLLGACAPPEGPGCSHSSTPCPASCWTRPGGSRCRLRGTWGRPWW